MNASIVLNVTHLIARFYFFRIRIHVPVKHHTHYHTKTVIKHIPVKHHEIEEVHKPYKYHHRLADDDDADDEDIIWPQKPYIKKKKFHHPFMKK